MTPREGRKGHTSKGSLSARTDSGSAKQWKVKRLAPLPAEQIQSDPWLSFSDTPALSPWRLPPPPPPAPQSELEIAAQAAQREIANRIAERYVGGLARLSEEQRLWRKKHDALVRKKKQQAKTEDLPYVARREASGSPRPAESAKPLLLPVVQQEHSPRRASSTSLRGKAAEPATRGSSDLAEPKPRLSWVRRKSAETSDLPWPSGKGDDVPIMSSRSFRNNRSSLLQVQEPQAQETDRAGSKSSPTILTNSSCSFEQCVALAKKHRLPMETVKQAAEEFMVLDLDKNGRLEQHEFEQAVRKRCDLDPAKPIPPHLLTQNWNDANLDNDGDLTFEEFLQWSVKNAFLEEMLVDPKDRELRALARNQNFNILQVEECRAVFDRFDFDKSGFIEEEEFRQVLAVLWNLPEKELPGKRMRRFWSEVDTDRLGKVSFKSFAMWWFKVYHGGLSG